MGKLKSRKLWMAVAGAASIFAADYWGVNVAPEALMGIAAIVASYIGIQGIVDKSVVTKQVEVAADIGRAQLENYARNLETQLEAVTAQLNVPTLTSVPDMDTVN
jgi:uncharacterized membrane protein